MSDLENRDDELVEALRRLPREMTPPSRVASSLLSSVGIGKSAHPRLAWRIAVAASLVLAAFALGRVTAPPPTSAGATAGAPSGIAVEGQKFAFLLYGGSTGGGDDRAAEYGAWAMDLRRAGRQATGERLADEAWTAGSPASDPLPLRGFFIIRARDSEEALELARRHPHARDGSVVVRPIDTP
jgi:hypothetical protein